MFLAIDESISGPYTTLSCLCLPTDLLPEIEKQILQFRIEQKIWGEIKWSKLSSAYLTKYKLFCTKYLSQQNVTVHTWTYKSISKADIVRYWKGDESTIIYKQAYMLIRSVIRKCLNNGSDRNFYILADETGNLGRGQYEVTQKLLIEDSSIKPKPNIDFCKTGNSNVLAALQISDIVCGATSGIYNKSMSDTQKELVDHLIDLNSGVNLVNFVPMLPKLNDFKIHHCSFRK